MTATAGVRLLLDEMFSPAIAAELRQLRHDVREGLPSEPPAPSVTEWWLADRE
jgi:hypothetical protein